MQADTAVSRGAVFHLSPVSWEGISQYIEIPLDPEQHWSIGRRQLLEPPNGSRHLVDPSAYLLTSGNHIQFKMENGIVKCINTARNWKGPQLNDQLLPTRVWTTLGGGDVLGFILEHFRFKVCHGPAPSAQHSTADLATPATLASSKRSLVSNNPHHGPRSFPPLHPLSPLSHCPNPCDAGR